MYFGWHYDPTYVLVIIGTLLCLIASANVKATFAKYSQIANRRGMTGAQAAQRILALAGISNVKIERISGDMTDHYDSRTKTLRLSDTVYNKTSVAAIGVAAHECGHAIQDAKKYAPLKIRHMLVPVANFGTNAAWFVLIIGTLFTSSNFLIQLGLFMFSLGVLFHIVTLPVEFNASIRAINILRDNNILTTEELRPTKKVLTAAALTYVAAAVSMVLSLLRLVLIFGGRDND